MILTFAQGFIMGGGLIVAIGAQNAFVLSNGIRRSHLLLIPLICSICDITLIVLGLAGTGSVIAAHPHLGQWAAWGGALFLFWYGLRAFSSAVRGTSMETGKVPAGSLSAVIGTTLAVSLLNPQAILDTVVLLGSAGGRFVGTGRILFGLGAILASVIWFFSLSFGGKMLAPVFRRPVSWRVLDSTVGISMWTIAFFLVG
ncbi:MAG TPA: amino acid transporter [Proteobacteria bacterium]|nr:arginine exporter protein ArgO [bacterium BMS3Abin14]HDL53752.1 amino acid transporter [Pseudomonadota bacterium]